MTIILGFLLVGGGGGGGRGGRSVTPLNTNSNKQFFKIDLHAFLRELFVEKSKHFLDCDLFDNSHNFSFCQCSDVVRRKSLLITQRAGREGLSERLQ